MLKTIQELRRTGLIIVAFLTAAIPTCSADIVSGAGATFPYPIYAKWAEKYKAKTNIGINYQSIGSGGGIKQIHAKTVDFGASDEPLTTDELTKWDLIQFPTVIGGVVPVVNLDSIRQDRIKLTGSLLAKIYLGKITKWSDPAITALNKSMKLPDTTITVVHRSDSSGATFNFTYYLNAIEPSWARVGVATAVEWPVGLGGKGNDGVTAIVSQTKGSIGYVEFAFAEKNKLIYTELQNRDGKFVKPSLKAFQAAADNADWRHAPDFYLILSNQSGVTSWPIVAATFILIHKMQDRPEAARDILKFFTWAYAEGDEIAKDLDYVPMPDNVVHLVEDNWKRVVDTSGAPAL